MTEVETAPAEARNRQQLREHVVRATAELLALGGREAVSTRAVAAAAGTQAPTIYRLFGDKAGLLDAVIEHGYATYLAAKPRPNASADPVAELRAGWEVHVGFGLANPALFSLMYAEPDLARPSETAVTALGMLRERLRAIAAAGRLRVEASMAADMVHAAATGVVLTLLATAPARRDLALSMRTLDAVLAAVTTDVAAPNEPGPVPAANTLRAELSTLTTLTSAERTLLAQWLDRITTTDRPEPTHHL